MVDSNFKNSNLHRQKKDRYLHILEMNVKSLRSNFKSLVHSSMIGQETTDESSMSISDEGEISVPSPISSQVYSDLLNDSSMKNLQSSVCASNLVHSCQALMDLISELKTSYILGGSISKQQTDEILCKLNWNESIISFSA
eukprot:333987_1